MSELIVGAGKVGRSLALALRRAGRPVTLVSYRRLRISGAPALVVCAVRDGELPRLAGLLAGRLPRRTPVVHCAGGHGPEVLGPLAELGHPVGVLHPLVSFAGPRTELAGAGAVVWGAPLAVRRASALARAAGLLAVRPDRLDPAVYHAAAALLANGSVALASAAASLLCRAGIAPGQTARLLGPLLGSVAANLTKLGPGLALTGPVRRGDSDMISRHLSAIAGSPEAAVYADSIRHQLLLMHGEAGRRLRQQGCDLQGLRAIGVAVADGASARGGVRKKRARSHR